MNEKRTIDQIIDSIFALINEAKKTSIQIENKTQKTLMLSDLDAINIEEKKVINGSSQNKLKKNDIYNWSNMQFNNSNVLVKSSETVLNKKIEKKFEEEIEKWSKKKIPSLLDKELKIHTSKLLKKKIF